MSETITAIYEGGVLRPLRPLSLPEHSRVQLRVLKTRERDSLREQTIRALLSTGRVGRLHIDLVPAQPEAESRREPPTVLGPSLADTIITQRRGDA